MQKKAATYNSILSGKFSFCNSPIAFLNVVPDIQDENVQEEVVEEFDEVIDEDIEEKEDNKKTDKQVSLFSF